MPSTIKRFNGTAWVTVADFDGMATDADVADIDARIDILEAFNTALTTTGLTAGNAEVGPRDAPYQAQARFGHKDGATNLHGYLASADGSLEINLGTGKTLSVYDHGTGLAASLAASKSNISGMGIGASPPHGAAYTSLWRAAAEAANDYGMLLTSTETILNVPSGGTMSFRRANSTTLSIATDNLVSAAGVVKATGNVEIGNHSIYFPSYSGGWYMADSTWIRSSNSKNVWLGNGWFGADGGITIGRGGGIDANYKLDVNGSGHVWGSLWVSSALSTDNKLSCIWDAGTNINWNNAHMMVYGQGNGASQTRLSLHSPGAAVQIRIIGAYGDVFDFINQSASTHCPVQASVFRVPSTVRIKKDVRSLRPDRDTIPVELDPFSDTIDAPPDIMSLNVVTYRPKIGQLEIVPTDPSGDYDTVDTKDPTTFESVERTGIVGEQSRRERLGLIAEEVQYVVPSAVFHEPDGTPQALAYEQITLAMLDHVQQLTALVQTLKYRVAELERQPGEQQ